MYKTREEQKVGRLSWQGTEEGRFVRMSKYGVLRVFGKNKAVSAIKSTEEQCRINQFETPVPTS